jgi:hypothetical protein
MPRRERKPPVRDTRSARRKCLDYVLRHPGSTAEHVASGTRLRMTQVTPRLSDLVHDGTLDRSETRDGRNRAGVPVHTYKPASLLDLARRAEAGEKERPKCPTCGRVVRQNAALEAGDAIREA